MCCPHLPRVCKYAAVFTNTQVDFSNARLLRTRQPSVYFIQKTNQEQTRESPPKYSSVDPWCFFWVVFKLFKLKHTVLCCGRGLPPHHLTPRQPSACVSWYLHYRTPSSYRGFECFEAIVTSPVSQKKTRTECSYLRFSPPFVRLRSTQGNHIAQSPLGWK